MQNYYDTATNKQYAFEDNVVVSGAPGAFVFTAPNGGILGPYPSTLVAGVAPIIPTVMTLAQQAQAAYSAAVAAGVKITSTGTPALNGTYPLDQVSLGRITSEQVYIATTQKFTNGATTRAWMDAGGTPHLFPSVAEFTAFAEVCAQYDDALIAALDAGLAGGAWVAPPQPLAIP